MIGRLLAPGAALAVAGLLGGCGPSDIEEFRALKEAGKVTVEFTNPNSNSGEPVMGCVLDAEGFQQDCRFFRAANKMILEDRERLFLENQGMRAKWPEGEPPNATTRKQYRGLWAASQKACTTKGDKSHLRIGVHHVQFHNRGGGLAWFRTVTVREQEFYINTTPHQGEIVHFRLSPNGRQLTEVRPAGDITRMKCEGL